MLCSRCEGTHLLTTPHVLLSCPAPKAIWGALLWYAERQFGRQFACSETFLLLGIFSNPGEKALSASDGWCALRAWVLFGCWLDWTASFFGGRADAPATQIGLLAWQRAVQTCRLAWFATKEDPVKGRPPPHKSFFTWGMVERDSANQIRWVAELPFSLRQELGRRDTRRRALTAPSSGDGDLAPTAESPPQGQHEDI